MHNSTITLALERAGFSSLDSFLTAKGLPPAAAEPALLPYLVGYELHRVRPGDTCTAIAAQYGSSPAAIAVANPNRQPERLIPGEILIVPLNFSLVPENTPLTSELLHYVIRGLEARYPLLTGMELGHSEYGRSISLLRVGHGPRIVYYNASHHANEYITTSLVMTLLESYLSAVAFASPLLGTDLTHAPEEVTLLLAPMVNPDGVDLVLGSVTAREYDIARQISSNYPQIPFPEGWKANLRGVDLNLNYPARWDEARKIKFEQGFETPAPRDYVGTAPLSEQESRAMFDSTEEISPDLTISWHTQGKEIYWKFLDLAPAGAQELGEQMAALSGYRLSEIPYASSFAGYKDWFIQDFDRPGYTIEAGLGENPLPLSQLPQMVQDNLPIFLLGLAGFVPSVAVQTSQSTPIASLPDRKPGQLSRNGQSGRWG